MRREVPHRDAFAATNPLILGYSQYMSMSRHDDAAEQPISTLPLEVTGVGVLDRVAAILDAVEATPLRASELARRLGITVPTAHRLVRAMVVHGFLQRDAEGRHHPGHRFLVTALARVSEPVLVDLADKTGESCQFWVRRGVQRVCLTSVESKHELRAFLPASTMLLLSDGGSAADALQATQGTPEWYEGVAARTPGLCSVSAPVWLDDEVVGAVCVSAPISRAPKGPGVLFGADAAASARRIEEELRLMT